MIVLRMLCTTCGKLRPRAARREACRDCYNAYMRVYNLTRYHRRRTEAIETLGGKCTACANTESLEFDHIDPETKTGEIGKLFTMGEKRLQVELLKCHLLCKKCHALKTAQQRSVEHGGGKTGKKDCRCDLCRPLKNSIIIQCRRIRILNMDWTKYILCPKCYSDTGAPCRKMRYPNSKVKSAMKVPHKERSKLQ